MGTSGFMGIVVDGKQKIGYAHWDAYPAALGCDTLDALRTLLAEDRKGARKRAQALKVVTQDTPPTPDEQRALARFADQGVSTKALDEWYVLLRRTQGDLGAVLDAGYVEDASQAPYDSLYSEWGYLVDFDAKVFEVYKGFQTRPHAQGRFATGSGPDRLKVLGRNYYPCALIGAWAFDALPTNAAFVAQTDPEEEDENDRHGDEHDNE